jgi:hypothetical protein
MPNKSKLDLHFPLFPVFILCFAFTLLLLTLSPYFRQYQSTVSTTPTPVPNPTISTSLPLPTSSPIFSQFTDSRQKIAISYPNNWAVNASPPAENEINFNAPDGSSLRISVIKTNNLKSTEITNSVAVNYGGFPAFQKSEKYDTAQITTLVTYFLRPNQVYKVEIVPTMDQSEISDAQKALYDQMLSTIKFH